MNSSIPRALFDPNSREDCTRALRRLREAPSAEAFQMTEAITVKILRALLRHSVQAARLAKKFECRIDCG